jgi:hypothetical protein
MRSINGTYELPPGESYGVLVLLRFEDGKFRGRLFTQQLTGSMEGSRFVSYQLLWGKVPAGGYRMVGVTAFPGGAHTGIAPIEKGEFLPGLENGHQTVGGNDEVRGYHVLASVSGKETRAGKEASAGRYESIEFMIDTRRFVAVLGVKTFPTQEQMFEAVFAREPADP